MKKVLINLLCLFVPSRKLRHKLRSLISKKKRNFCEEAKRLGITILKPGVNHLTKRNINISVAVDDNTVEFWSLFNSNHWENETFDIFDYYIGKDSIFIDIGAWIGPTVLYGGSLARATYAFEPDRVAFDKLKINLALNTETRNKISISNCGVGVQNEKVEFFVGAGATSASSIVPNIYNKGNSYFVDFYSFPTLIEKYDIDIRTVDLIKIDIEGGEYKLIPELMEYFKQVDFFPTMHISTHAPFLLEKEASAESMRKEYFKINNELLDVLHPYPFLYTNKFKRISTFVDVSNNIEFYDFIATTL